MSIREDLPLWLSAQFQERHIEHSERGRGHLLSQPDQLNQALEVNGVTDVTVRSHRDLLRAPSGRTRRELSPPDVTPGGDLQNPCLPYPYMHALIYICKRSLGSRPGCRTWVMKIGDTQVNLNSTLVANGLLLIPRPMKYLGNAYTKFLFGLLLLFIF